MPSFYVRLETATRYYVILLDRDLLGDLVLDRRWGGKGNRRGGGKRDVLMDEEEGERLARRILARRKAHGYAEVIPGASAPTRKRAI